MLYLYSAVHVKLVFKLIKVKRLMFVAFFKCFLTVHRDISVQ